MQLKSYQFTVYVNVAATTPEHAKSQIDAILKRGVDACGDDVHFEYSEIGDDWECEDDDVEDDAQ